MENKLLVVNYKLEPAPETDLDDAGLIQGNEAHIFLRDLLGVLLMDQNLNLSLQATTEKGSLTLQAKYQVSNDT